MTKPFPDFPSDEVLAALVEEVTTTPTLFGRATGSGDHELLRPEHAIMRPTIDVALMDGFGPCIYMPGAEPGVPEGWRTLREHELHRASANAGLHYKFKEYLPDVQRIAADVKWLGADVRFDEDASKYAGVAEATYQTLIKALTTRLGKPKRRQKQKVEWEWGGPNAQPVFGDPTYGLLRLQFGTQKEIGYPGGPTAPWGLAYFVVEVGGVPRT
jgi:hypothetical protein